MGKKISHAWQKGSDGMVTDHKMRLQSGEDGVAGDRTFSEAMEGKFSQDQPIPPDVLQPDVHEARERELTRQEHVHKQQRRRARARRRKGSRS